MIFLGDSRALFHDNEGQELTGTIGDLDDLEMDEDEDEMYV